MPLMLMAFMAQIIVIAIIVVILKKILDRMLIDLAISLFEYNASGQSPSGPITITTHKRLKSKYQAAIVKAAQKHSWPLDQIQYKIDKKIYGGMIIRTDKRIFDCSLKDRLRQALPGHFR